MYAGMHADMQVDMHIAIPWACATHHSKAPVREVLLSIALVGDSPACPFAVSFWVFVLFFVVGLVPFWARGGVFFLLLFVVLAGVSEIESWKT